MLFSPFHRCTTERGGMLPWKQQTKATNRDVCWRPPSACVCTFALWILISISQEANAFFSNVCTIHGHWPSIELAFSSAVDLDGRSSSACQLCFAGVIFFKGYRIGAYFCVFDRSDSEETRPPYSTAIFFQSVTSKQVAPLFGDEAQNAERAVC